MSGRRRSKRKVWIRLNIDARVKGAAASTKRVKFSRRDCVVKRKGTWL